MPDRPETSTVRSALDAVAAAEDALDVRVPAPDRVHRLVDLIAAVRDLRAHQIDDLSDYLIARASRDRPAQQEADPS